MGIRDRSMRHSFQSCSFINKQRQGEYVGGLFGGDWWKGIEKDIITIFLIL